MGEAAKKMAQGGADFSVLGPDDEKAWMKAVAGEEELANIPNQARGPQKLSPPASSERFSVVDFMIEGGGLTLGMCAQIVAVFGEFPAQLNRLYRFLRWT